MRDTCSSSTKSSCWPGSLSSIDLAQTQRRVTPALCIAVGAPEWEDASSTPDAGMCAGGKLEAHKPTQARISGLFEGASPFKQGWTCPRPLQGYVPTLGHLDQEWRRS